MNKMTVHATTLDLLKTVLETSLDAVCILGHACEILYVNPAMRAFLEKKHRELKKRPIFCDLVKLHACRHGCILEKMQKHGTKVRLDESPAVVAGRKARILLQAVPIFEHSVRAKGHPVASGAILQLRDTTAELLVQAKYEKLQTIIEERNAEIADLSRKLEDLRDTLRFKRW